MVRDKLPVTPAVRFLNKEKVAYTGHLYDYEEHGGTTASARQFGINEHIVIKTLVMEDEKKNPLLILMHGDMKVSTKKLARHLGVKAITPCTPEIATRHTGYLVGGTSPFGTKRKLPVYLEETIVDLPQIYINGGKRGFLVIMEPRELLRLLNPVLVKVGIN
ncbi:MAG: Cys-tRNA(Pro) deacylase [Peptococcaceae bacterium]|jgi:Cys-tRNA(Pro) deacylase|nr:Cys-tRNA(Pro) deacylase [Peptococcaceae bacterium]